MFEAWNLLGILTDYILLVLAMDTLHGNGIKAFAVTYIQLLLPSFTRFWQFYNLIPSHG